MLHFAVYGYLNIILLAQMWAFSERQDHGMTRRDIVTVRYTIYERPYKTVISNLLLLLLLMRCSRNSLAFLFLLLKSAKRFVSVVAASRLTMVVFIIFSAISPKLLIC